MILSRTDASLPPTRDSVVETAGVQKSRFYRPELDLLRFLSFFMVFISHSPLLQVGSNDPEWRRILVPLYMKWKLMGAFGMGMFFLLSAFLITELLLREREKTGTIHLRAFYIRRVCRIWPIYIFILVLAWTLGQFFPDSLWMSWRRVAAFFLMYGNWYVMFNGWGPFSSGHLWSISLEEQFYVLWPTLALGGRKLLAGSSCVLILLSFATIFLMAVRGHSSFSAALWFNSLAQFLYFAAGSLISILLYGKTPKFSTAARACLAVAGLALWFLTSAPTIHNNQLLAWALLGIATAILFIAVLGMRVSFVPRHFLHLGKISYGLYVYHGLAFVIFENSLRGTRFHTVWVSILALAATIVMATLSYRFLEQPFLRIKERFTFVPSRAI